MTNRAKDYLCHILLIIIIAGIVGCSKKEEPVYSKLVKVPFNQVHVDDPFWSQRIQTIQDTTIYDLLKIAEEQGKIDNLRILARDKQGKIKLFVAPDSDLWKIIEAASYTLAWKRDAALENKLDELISLYAAAQADDGYMNQIFMLPDSAFLHREGWNRPEFRLGFGSDERFKGAFDEWPSGLGQLYSAGHLMVAGVAYYRATGKRNLLNIAIKMADCIYREFPPGQPFDYADHPGLGLGLVQLYEVTGEERYLELSKHIVYHGNHARPVDLGDGENRKPVYEQREAWGHAVCLNYLYNGAAELCRYQGEPETRIALDSLWQSIVDSRIYIHGGVGGPGPHEQMADDWVLPPADTYSESCANIATGEWNHKMNLLYADAKYADIMEIEAYNGALSGISLDGTKYLYTNPLYADLEHRQSYRSGVRTRYLFCCPSKLPGFVAGINRWIYAKNDAGIFVNLFIGSTIDTDVKGKKVTIHQKTEYPWKENVTITIQPEKKVNFDLSIRIPRWVRSGGNFPSEIYRFAKNKELAWQVTVNGETLEVENLEKGYLRLTREWQPGDKVELTFPMPVRKVYSHPNIEDTKNMVALMRGPVLYCLEGVDNDFNILEAALVPGPEMTSVYKKDLLGGIVAIQGKAVSAGNEPQNFTAIPYYAWQNRGIHTMTTWMYTVADQIHANAAIEQNNSNETIEELTK